ncbi:hypothetical protein [Blastococcus deserti]|uniref:Uncharacterized protein n=1 Tax=Blastococcus deserti TaxID=2259033 RepID=A0ABW4XC55_9ACTN
MSGAPPVRPTPAPEVRRAQVTTWVALVVVAGGSAGAFLLDQDANPVAQGLLAVVAALEIMLAVVWWRSRRRRDRP